MIILIKLLHNKIIKINEQKKLYRFIDAFNYIIRLFGRFF